MLNNLPGVRLALVAVSRNCFPKSLSENRRRRVAEAYRARYGELYELRTVVENEDDMRAALAELRAAGANALAVYLGNFGPETPETLLAQAFGGPVMFAAAAEESGEDLLEGRGDAYCGLLNASYNLKLRSVRAYIPAAPVGDAGAVAEMMGEFLPIARALLGAAGLKIITFGPRPQDFMACNAPIKPLFGLGTEIEENSELDLYQAFLAHGGDPRIPGVMEEMAAELLPGGAPEAPLLERFAQYELALLDWAETHKGAKDYVVFANKCWPAYQHFFGFVPCYNNSRMAARGIPVSCEADVYGALSEYLGMCVSGDIVTLLDINNTVPADLYASEIAPRYPYSATDVFMGFHCGNTSSARLRRGRLGHHVIMCRTAGMETSMGTLNGNIIPGGVTLYRLQGTADCRLTAYAAQGEVLDVDCRSFGGIGVFAVQDMGRFYRHVLLERGFPHHAAVAFGRHGAAIFEVLRLLGAEEVGYNRPSGLPYPGENPFR